MLKHLLKFSAFLLLSLCLWVSNTFASAKMEVPLGQQVVLQTEAVQAGFDYKWVVTKDKSIVNTQSGNVFTYTFDVQGEYEINVALNNELGNVKNTTIKVMVGGRYSKPVSGSSGGQFDDVLKAVVSTLPTMDANHTVHILGEEGTVVFDIESRADVLEYRIDRNINVDSDGNGIPNDDVDNAADPSYLRGGIWRTEYNSNESPIVAEVTLVSTSGKKVTETITVMFDEFLASDAQVTAVLDSLPPVNSADRKIYVYRDQGTVAFYARRSQGQIVEYRFDKNIFVDSDGDGNPANDIDNRSDASFKSGDVWMTDYQETGNQIIAQLIVVTAQGKGSQIQREIVFIDRPVTQNPETGDTSGGIQLVADKEFVQIGDPIEFLVKGLLQSLNNYTFDWDFDGDGVYDQTVEGSNTATYIYDTPGTPLVAVHILDNSGNEATFSREILVRDVAVTAANFEATVDGLTVNFTNNSTVAAALENKSLTYTWSFGDTDEANYEAQKDLIGVASPSYTYAQPGNYVVTLTVTDEEDTADTKSMEIQVGEGNSGAVDEQPQETEQPEKSGSLVGKIFKIILYIFLIILLLILLIVGGLLAFLKIQNPDLVLEELIDELKIKILSTLGLHDALEEVAPQAAAKGPGVTGGVIPPYHPTAQPEPKPAAKPSQAKPTEAGASAGSGSQATASVNVNVDLSKAPDWLKEKPKTDNKSAQVIEGEVVEDRPKPKISSDARPAPKPTVMPESKPQTVPKAPTAPQPNPSATPQVAPKAPSNPQASAPQNPQPKAPVAEKPAPAPGPKPTPASSSQPIQPKPAPTPSANNEKPAQASPANDQAPKKDLNQSDGPMPDWLKEK